MRTIPLARAGAWRQRRAGQTKDQGSCAHCGQKAINICNFPIRATVLPGVEDFAELNLGQGWILYGLINIEDFQ